MNRDASIPVMVEVSLDPQEIERSLDCETLVEFIKQLDAAAQYWSVTLPLCEHFAKLAEEHKREEAEDKARRNSLGRGP